MNIVLIGYRCSGKTSVGKIIAEKINRKFIDTDVMIEEKAGSSIEEIVEGKGWEYFRDLEKKVIKEVSEMDNLVIATGGGVVTDVENIKNIKRSGFVVWLKAGMDILKGRMQEERGSGMARPSLTGKEPTEEIKDVLDVRNPMYDNAGDIVIETDRVSAAKVAESIILEAKKRFGL